MGSATQTPSYQAVNANIANDGSADSPRGYAVSSGASGYTFTATGASRVRYSAPSGGACYVTLPKTGIKAGVVYEVLVTGATETNCVVVRSYGTNGTDGVELGGVGYGRIGGEGKITVMALVDTPAAQTDWTVTDVWESSYFTWIPATGAGSGANYGSAATSRVARTNRNVCLTLSTSAVTLTTGTAATTAIATNAAALPLRFRPISSGKGVAVEVQEVSTYSAGFTTVGTDGNYTFYKINESSWTSSVQCRLLGTAGFCISYEMT